MMRILFVAEEPCQVVSYWRGMGLFSDLMRAHPGEYEAVHLTGEINWQSMRQFDVLWLVRPSTAQFEPLMRMATTQGVAIVVDWDDLIFEVPFGNPVRNRIRGERMHLAALYMARASLVTVSTAQLASSFKERGLSVPMRVLPNALTDRYVWAKDQPPPQKTVLWRGSPVHDGDIDEVGDDIVALAEEFADWNWVFAGFDPWRITKRLREDSWTSFEVQPIADYHHMIVGLCPSIIMSPLQDNEFNRCKSRIGVFDAAMAGGTFVCPDFPVFQFGSTRYSHQVVERSFHAAMSDELSMDPLGHRTGALAARLLIDERERTRHTLPILKSILESAVSA